MFLQRNTFTDLWPYNVIYSLIYGHIMLIIQHKGVYGYVENKIPASIPISFISTCNRVWPNIDCAMSNNRRDFLPDAPLGALHHK